MSDKNIKKKEFFEYTKKNIVKKLTSPDQRIIYLSQITNKLPEQINEMYEQLRIITDRKYPTLDSYLNIKEYCEFVYYGKKNNLKIKEIIDLDIGVGFSEKEESIIKKISKNILDMIDIKENILENIEKLFEENYKNFKEIATTTIACKMLEIAGSFKRLCEMPASTVQLLGSEKSFFSALRKHKKTPKYGVIYNHPLMVSLSNRNKGRFARTLASKIAIAVKADINKSLIYKELYKKLEKKVKNYGK